MHVILTRMFLFNSQILKLASFITQFLIRLGKVIHAKFILLVGQE
jgi:hypothetical protein